VTVLIGGSILLIAASAIALGFGWVTADESLIWTSIAASVGAGVLLALGVLWFFMRDRRSILIIALVVVILFLH
jgi:hypothetical protein